MKYIAGMHWRDLKKATSRSKDSAEVVLQRSPQTEFACRTFVCFVWNEWRSKRRKAPYEIRSFTDCYDDLPLRVCECASAHINNSRRSSFSSHRYTCTPQLLLFVCFHTIFYEMLIHLSSNTYTHSTQQTLTFIQSKRKQVLHMHSSHTPVIGWHAHHLTISCAHDSRVTSMLLNEKQTAEGITITHTYWSARFGSTRLERQYFILF